MPRPNVTPKGLVLVLVALLATTGVAMAVQAVRMAAKPPTFTMTATPGVRTMAPGGSVRYEVKIDPKHGFHAGIQIGLGEVPRGSEAVWRLPDGRALPRAHYTRKRTSQRYLRSATLPAGLPAGTRKAFVDVTPPASFRGRLRPQIRATAGEIRRRMRVHLLVVTGEPFQAPSRSALVIVSPATRTVLQGDVTQYDVEVDPGDGTPPTDFSVSGLPAGATASFGPSSPPDPRRRVLSIETQRSTPTGANDLTVTASDGASTASGATSLLVAETKDFTMSGDVVAALSPGSTSPIALRFANPYDFPLVVERLDFGVTTGATGCDADENFAVKGVDLDTTPLTLPPGDSTIEELVSDPEKRPAVTMRNLSTDQEACKDVPLTLTFSGAARK